MGDFAGAEDGMSAFSFISQAPGADTAQAGGAGASASAGFSFIATSSEPEPEPEAVVESAIYAAAAVVDEDPGHESEPESADAGKRLAVAGSSPRAALEGVPPSSRSSGRRAFGATLPPPTADWDEEEQEYIRCCPDHDDEILSLVSLKTNTPVCSWCLIDGEHIGEESENLAMYVEKRRTLLQERLGKLQGITSKMEARGDKFKAQPAQLEEWSNELRELIQDRVAEMQEILAMQEEQLEGQVRELAKQIREDAADRASALDRTLLSLVELTESVRSLLPAPP